MNSGLAVHILHVHVPIQVNVQVYFGILWGTLGYRPFCCGHSVFGEWFPFMVVGFTIFSQNLAVFPPSNSKRLNANLNDDDAKETMENLEKYMFRRKLPCLSRELVGNMGNHWKPYCNWFCWDRLPEVEQPNTHLAHRLPSIVRPSLAPCRPGNGGHDEHQEQSLLHWEHNMGVTIGFVHML